MENTHIWSNVAPKYLNNERFEKCSIEKSWLEGRKRKRLGKKTTTTKKHTI
jgi:hypothetical protein